MSEQHVSEKCASFQEFLDNYQYSKEGILSYEKIFGYTYVSTGGEKTTQEFCELLHLQAGQRVLDLCCGIGGASFYMVRKFGVNVVGVDLSQNMLDIAHIRRQELKMEDHVTFQHADVTKVDFDEGSFDAINCRDSILHVKEKLELFQKCLKWLKPGGRLLITDYCCTGEKWSQEYTEYVASRGYYLTTVEEYAKLISEAGFVNVQGIDKTAAFIQVLHEELQSIADKKEEFYKDGLSETSYNHIVEGWRSKLRRSERGEQRWGLFLAEKARNT